MNRFSVAFEILKRSFTEDQLVHKDHLQSQFFYYVRGKF